jgi:hypothetical protein
MYDIIILLCTGTAKLFKISLTQKTASAERDYELECIKGRGKHLSLIEVKFDNAATLESYQYTNFTTITTKDRLCSSSFV